MGLGYKINGLEAFPTYGIVFPKGLDKQLLKLPKKKETGTEHSYPDHNGTERSGVNTPFYESSIITIQVLFKANNAADFFQKYGAFRSFILTAGYFNFDIESMNLRFRLLYQDMSDFDKLTAFGQGVVGCTATLVLVNDFPTEFNQITL